MASIALVVHSFSDNQYINTKAALENKGHTVTGYLETNYATNDYSGMDVIVVTKIWTNAYYTDPIRAANDAGTPLLVGMIGQPATAGNNPIGPPQYLKLTGDIWIVTSYAGATEINITDGAHAITSEFGTGRLVVYSGANSWGCIDSGESYVGDALSLGDPDVAAVSGLVETIAIEAGTLDLASNALGARVIVTGVLWPDLAAHSADGETFLDNCITWLTGGRPGAPTLTASGLATSILAQTSTFSPAPDQPTDTHVATTFEVAASGDPSFSSPLFAFDYEDPSPYLLGGILEGVGAATTYWVRARHEGGLGGWSAWSTAVSVTTEAAEPVPNTPTVTVTDTGTDYVEAQGSAFSHPDGTTTTGDNFDPASPLPYLEFAEFQIRVKSSGTVVVDTGPMLVGGDATYGTHLSEGLADDTTFEIRLRYWDGYRKNSSAWSSWVEFSTDAVPAVQPVAPAVTVVECGIGYAVLQTAAFSHPEGGAVHTATRWRMTLQTDAGSLSFVTTTPAELLAYRWEQLDEGTWDFDAAHQDDSGRWSDFGTSDSCTQLARPEPPRFLQAGGVRFCTAGTIRWDMPATPVVAWRFTGQISSDDGATWTTIFSNTTAESYAFSLTGRPDGAYLIRVRANHPGSSYAGDWSYLIVRVDRTCDEVIHYDFSTITQLDPDWEVIWDTRADWSLCDSEGNPGFGLGILAHGDPQNTQIYSALVFPELGQPVTYEAEIEFILFGEEWQTWWWRWMDNEFMRPGLAYSASGDPRLDTMSGAFTYCKQRVIYPFPHFGGDCPYGDCLNICASATGCQCDTALAFTLGQRRAYPEKMWLYGVGYRAAELEQMVFRNADDVPISPSLLHYKTTDVPYAGSLIRGMQVSTRRGASCLYRHRRYTMRQKIARTVTGGVRIRAQLIGPGLDPAQGWIMDDELTFEQLRSIECGYTGLALYHIWRAIDDPKGIVFTSFTISNREYDICEPPPEFVEEEAESEPQDLVSRPCVVILFVYEEDRETVAWQVGDYSDHPNPYLCLLENYGEQEVDFVAGAVTIGQVEVVVIDRRQTAGDQDSGWMTERLSEGGLGVIHGRRCRVIRYISEELGWVVIADGPASPPRLDESYSAFRWVIRDTRDTERKIRAFVSANTSWLLPMGVGDGFGAYVDENEVSQWLVPPADPLVGDYSYDPTDEDAKGFVIFPDYWSGAFSPQGTPYGTQTVDEDVVILPDIQTYATSAGLALGDPRPVYYEWPGLEVLWRPSGSSADWTVIQPTHLLVDERTAKPRGEEYFIPPRPLIYAKAAELVDGTEVLAAYRILLRGNQAEGTFPTDGDEIEVAVRYTGPPTETYPLHIEGITTGQLLKNLYDGVYSRRDPITGAVVPTGIRYAEADLLAMTDPVLMRITEPWDDAREKAEKLIYAPSGWAATLDNDGRISPKSQVPPDDFEGLTEINDSIAEPSPDWDAGERTVNILTFEYPRFYRVDVDDAEAVDRLEIREISHEFRSEASITNHDDQKVQYDGSAFAAIGDELAQPVLSLEAEKGYQHALARELYIFDRYKDGAPAWSLAVMRDFTSQLRAGDWVTTDLSWLPDYLTRRRGLITGGQILAVHDVDCAWRILLIEEAFPLEES